MSNQHQADASFAYEPRLLGQGALSNQTGQTSGGVCRGAAIQRTLAESTLAQGGTTM